MDFHDCVFWYAFHHKMINAFHLQLPKVKRLFSFDIPTGIHSDITISCLFILKWFHWIHWMLIFKRILWPSTKVMISKMSITIFNTCKLVEYGDLNKISHFLFAQFESISYQCHLTATFFKKVIPKKVTFDINSNLKFSKMNILILLISFLLQIIFAHNITKRQISVSVGEFGFTWNGNSLSKNF